MARALAQAQARQSTRRDAQGSVESEPIAMADLDDSSLPAPTWPGRLSMGCAVWFLLTGWMWPYGAALFVAYPVGLAGLVFWRKARTLAPEASTTRWSGGLLALGLATSGLAVFLYR